MHERAPLERECTSTAIQPLLHSLVRIQPILNFLWKRVHAKIEKALSLGLWCVCFIEFQPNSYYSRCERHLFYFSLRRTPLPGC